MWRCRSCYDAVRESRDELSKWFTWCTENYSRDDSQKFINSQAEKSKCGKYDFAIVDYDTDCFLGSCGLQVDENNNKVANISYWVRKCAVGKGVATRAARLLVTFGFETLELNKIMFKMAVCNKGSIKVAKRCGTKEVPKEGETLEVKNKSYAARRFELTREDYRSMWNRIPENENQC